MDHSLLLSCIRRDVALSDAEADAIRIRFKPMAAKRNTTLVSENEVAQKLYFIVEGFVRVFHVEDGEEVTTQILNAGNFVTAFQSFTQATVSTDAVKSITACTLLQIEKTDYQALYDSNTRWAEFCKRVYEKVISQSVQRTKDILSLSAEKRYRKLLAQQPEMLQSVPLHYIASYIGIKPESLSRIRKQRIS